MRHSFKYLREVRIYYLPWGERLIEAMFNDGSEYEFLTSACIYRLPKCVDRAISEWSVFEFYVEHDGYRTFVEAYRHVA